MTTKTFSTVAAAVVAALVNIAYVAPACAQAKAALVRDVDRSTAQPVNGTCILDFNFDDCVLYTVPAGKRLVVETVSYLIHLRSGDTVAPIVFGKKGSLSNQLTGFGYPNTYSVAPTALPGSSSFYTATQALRIYIEENQLFIANTYPSGQISFSFSGYMVDK